MSKHKKYELLNISDIISNKEANDRGLPKGLPQSPYGDMADFMNRESMRGSSDSLSTRPRAEDFQFGQWDPRFEEQTRVWNQDNFGRDVDSPILEGTREWDILEAKKAKEKAVALKAKQDDLTRRDIQAKADAAERKAGVKQESWPWSDWLNSFKSKEK